MNYFDALKLATQGKRIRHSLWADGEYAVFSDRGILCIANTPVIIIKSELESEDWEEYEEKKLVTLSQLLFEMHLVKKESGMLTHEEVLKKVWERV